MTQPPLVAHIVFRLGVGGLENGLINLINRIPPERFRHAVICLTIATNYRQRLPRGVPVYELNLKEGKDLTAYPRVYRLLKELRPAVVHTRNLAALEFQVVAWLAGVRARVHGEHGWDVFDPDGKSLKYQRYRRILKLFVKRYIPLSRHLEGYLRDCIMIPDSKISRICNGVDTAVFHPSSVPDWSTIPGSSFSAERDTIVIGSVGRMHGVKDQLTLVRSFFRILEQRPDLRRKVRLVLVGDGPLREQAAAIIDAAGANQLVWMPGERTDIPDILRSLDIFVLPSKAEGISNTILEAMATGLPVIATAVGGNSELVTDGVTGRLVPKEDCEAMAAALLTYIDNPGERFAHGSAGLSTVRDQFTLDGMAKQYMAVYDHLLTDRM